MKALVIYDSIFGNTRIIAEAISKEFGGDARAVLVSDVDLGWLKEADLIVVGSPIRGWKPSEKMQEFLESLGKEQLKGVKAAAFDTRVKLFIHGDAAKKITQRLKNSGAKIIIEPQAFFVKGREGPLFDGEIKKAVQWAKVIKERASV